MTSSVKPEVHNIFHAVRGGPSHGHVQQAQKIWWSSAAQFSSYAFGQTHKQTRKQTDWLQYFATLTGRSNKLSRREAFGSGRGHVLPLIECIWSGDAGVPPPSDRSRWMDGSHDRCFTRAALSPTARVFGARSLRSLCTCMSYWA